MDKNRIEGKADQLKGKIKEASGALTDDESLRLKGQAEQVGGKLKEGYGKVKDELRAAKEQSDEREARSYDPDNP
jgi:uncharacterized protein YjbJ (UPF0337 family)